MEVQLKVLVGNNIGQVLKVPGPKFFIGRAEDCHLRPGSDLVSRHHCVLILEGSTLVIRDFGSKNGTLINGERIIGETTLNNGDHLKIGPLEFELQMSESLAGAKRPKVHSIKEAAVRTAESGVHEDLDLDALLGSNLVDTGDTREINRGDTAELEMGASETTVIKSPAPPATGAPAPEAETHQTQKPKVLGKSAPLPANANKSTGGSKDAAAEMLKRLRRR
jgi:pSer/pThr/pTyr-binding forkhead associated (FHA) protein